MTDKKDNGVSYKNPPKKTQFKKGQSGNPRGRPKKDESLDFVEICISLLNESVEITEGNIRKSITKKEAFIKTLLNKSLSGHTASSRILATLIQKTIIPHETQKNEITKINEEYKPVIIIDDIPRNTDIYD